MRLTQKNFDDLVALMNHNITDIKNGMATIIVDVKWLKRLYWSNMALLGTIGGALMAIAFVL